jgi:hypothetical protein
MAPSRSAAQQLFDSLVVPRNQSQTNGSTSSSIGAQVDSTNKALLELTKLLLQQQSSNSSTTMLQISTETIQAIIGKLQLPQAANGTAANATVTVSISIPNSPTSLVLSMTPGQSSSSVAVVSVVQYDKSSLQGSSNNKTSSSSTGAGTSIVDKIVSDIISVKISITNSTGGSKVTLPAFEANISVDTSTIPKSVATFRHNCTVGVPEHVRFYCTESKVLMTLNCSGLASAIVRRQCPIPKQVCNLLNLQDLSVTSGDYCQAVTSSAGFLTCKCGFTSSNNSAATTAAIIASGGAVNVAVMTEFVAGDFGTTVAISGSMNSAQFAKESSAVFIVFGCLWFIGLVFIVANYTVHSSPKLFRRVGHPEVVPTLTMAMIDECHTRMRAYIIATLPTIFDPTMTWWTRLARQFRSKHAYVRIVSHLLSPEPISGGEEERHFQRQKAILEVIQAMTSVTISFFLLALLYDLQYPADDGSCAFHRDEAACLFRRSLLDPSLTYCQWVPDRVQVAGVIAEIQNGRVMQVLDVHPDYVDDTLDDPCLFNGNANSMLASFLPIVLTAVVSIPIASVLSLLFALILTRSKKAAESRKLAVDALRHMQQGNQATALIQLSKEAMRMQDAARESVALVPRGETTAAAVEGNVVSPALGTAAMPMAAAGGGGARGGRRRAAVMPSAPPLPPPTALAAAPAASNAAASSMDAAAMVVAREPAATTTTMTTTTTTTALAPDANGNAPVFVKMRRVRSSRTSPGPHSSSFTGPRAHGTDDDGNGEDGANDDNVDDDDDDDDEGNVLGRWTRRGYRRLRRWIRRHWSVVKTQEIPEHVRWSRKQLIDTIHTHGFVVPSASTATAADGGSMNMNSLSVLLSLQDYDAAYAARVEHEAQLLRDDLRYATDVEFGTALLHQLVADVLDAEASPAAKRLYQFTVRKDFPVESSSSSEMLRFVSLGIIIVINLGALYYISLKGIQRGISWQLSFLRGCLLEWLFDVVVNESMEVLWVDFFLPSLILREVHVALRRVLTLSEHLLWRMVPPPPPPTAATPTPTAESASAAAVTAAAVVAPAPVTVHTEKAKAMKRLPVIRPTALPATSRALARDKDALWEAQLALLYYPPSASGKPTTSSASTAMNAASSAAGSTRRRRVTPTTTTTTIATTMTIAGGHQEPRYFLQLMSYLPLEGQFILTRTVMTLVLGSLLYGWYRISKVGVSYGLALVLYIAVCVVGFCVFFAWLLYRQLRRASRATRRVHALTMMSGATGSHGGEDDAAAAAAAAARPTPSEVIGRRRASIFERFVGEMKVADGAPPLDKAASGAVDSDGHDVDDESLRSRPSAASTTSEERDAEGRRGEAIDEDSWRSLLDGSRSSSTLTPLSLSSGGSSSSSRVSWRSSQLLSSSSSSSSWSLLRDSASSSSSAASERERERRRSSFLTSLFGNIDDDGSSSSAGESSETMSDAEEPLPPQPQQQQRSQWQRDRQQSDGSVASLLWDDVDEALDGASSSGSSNDRPDSIEDENGDHNATDAVSMAAAPPQRLTMVSQAPFSPTAATTAATTAAAANEATSPSSPLLARFTGSSSTHWPMFTIREDAVSTIDADPSTPIRRRSSAAVDTGLSHSHSHSYSSGSSGSGHARHHIINIDSDIDRGAQSWSSRFSSTQSSILRELVMDMDVLAAEAAATGGGNRLFDEDEDDDADDTAHELSEDEDNDEGDGGFRARRSFGVDWQSDADAADGGDGDGDDEGDGGGRDSLRLRDSLTSMLLAGSASGGGLRQRRSFSNATGGGGLASALSSSSLASDTSAGNGGGSSRRGSRRDSDAARRRVSFEGPGGLV